VIEILIAIGMLTLVGGFVAVPLRGAREEEPRGEDPVLADLEARKEAKYREIRDTELDRAQGKLEPDDFRRQDRELRAEAIELLKLIDAHRERAGRDDPDG
jgi:hypothetical protein